MVTSIPASDISFALNLNSSCSVTGTALVGGLLLQINPTTWSYNDGTGLLTIGSDSVPVLEGANTFETSFELIFPVVAERFEAVLPFLFDDDEIEDIIATCGSISAYISDLKMIWVR